MKSICLGIGSLALLVGLFITNLSLGASTVAPDDVLNSLFRFDPDELDHYIVVTQRLPRALIAIYVGATMAMSGAATQGITGNPLASPSTLGVSAGAVLFLLLSVYAFDAPLMAQGVAALIGGFAGFACAIAIARTTGLGPDPRGLPLILSGMLTSMLFMGMANAILLTDPARRSEYLSWLSGNINHFYVDRLFLFWPLGMVALVALMLLSKPITLISLGTERAESMGVHVKTVSFLVLCAVVLAASSAVAICGPVGFIGLVVPHLVRPIAGAHFARALPINACVGAGLCLVSDVLARMAFAPFTLHTGVLLDLLGGMTFGVIVYRFYLRPEVKS